MTGDPGGEGLCFGLDRIVGRSTLRLGHDMIANGTQGAIDEHVDALGCRASHQSGRSTA